MAKAKELKHMTYLAHFYVFIATDGLTVQAS
jgi:hypothetical protein